MTENPINNIVVRSEDGDYRLIEKISAQWQALNNEGPCCQPFFRPEWISAYLRAFAPASRLILISAWKGELLRGVLPLISDSLSSGLINFRVFRSASNIHSCRFDLIHGSNDKEEVARSVWNHLANRNDWDLIQLQDVPEDAAFNLCTSIAEEEKYNTAKIESVSPPYLNINDDIDNQKNGKQFRSRLGKKKQKLESSTGALVLEKISQYDQNILNDFFEMEGSGWKAQEGTAIKCSAETLQFYSEITKNAACNGYLSIYRLQSAQETIAIHLGLTMGDCYYLPKIAYAENFSEFSPGQILIKEIINNSKENGFSRIDFLGSTAQWKSVWTSQFNKHSTHHIFRNNIKGVIIYTIKFRLREHLRRIKRSLKR